MTEQRAEYRPTTYGTLEPGLQAAIDLLERERLNELNRSHHRASHGEAEDAAKLEAVAEGYAKAIELLKEQRVRLRTPVGSDSYVIQSA